MENKDIASMFKALGDPTRLSIFECLRGCCCPPAAFSEDGDVHRLIGATVGEVCCEVTGTDKITSTISFHLKELRNAGLITMEKRGKFMICAIDQEAVAKLLQYLESSSTVTCC